MRTLRNLAGLVKAKGIQMVQNIHRGFYAISVRHGLHRADYQRWSNRDELSEKWDERTAEIAKLIPAGASVVEFGAGKMVLKQLLPVDCQYTPSDLVDRGPGTLVMDLNSPVLPRLPPHDIAVLSGVVEYVADVPRLASYLATIAPKVIVAYMTVVGPSLRQSWQRRARGWSNDYTAVELMHLFGEAGYRFRERIPWRTLEIFQFDQDRAA